jgi:hypothetical protein
VHGEEVEERVKRVIFLSVMGDEDEDGEAFIYRMLVSNWWGKFFFQARQIRTLSLNACGRTFFSQPCNPIRPFDEVGKKITSFSIV